MDLESELESRNTSMEELERKKADLEVQEKREKRKFQKRQLRQRILKIDDFIEVNTLGQVYLDKDQLKRFIWNPDKYVHDSGMFSSGGWEYQGLYMGSAFYSLWARFGEGRKSLVYMLRDRKTMHLHSSRKDSPLVTIGEDIKTDVTQETLFPLRNGDICLYNGVPLFGDNQAFCFEIFEKVLNGKEILPKPKNGKSYTERGDGDGKGKKIEVRTYGQQFLEGLHPSERIQGELFGSGMEYVAYVFGEQVVVEANESARATYLMSRGEFDTLRVKPRSAILREKPEGFDGRVIHLKDGTADWEQSIRDYLKR